MPYTPPTHSPSVSPILSRSSSFSNNDKSPSSSTLHLLKGSNPPRSASYLHKHRRSPSVTSPSLSATIQFSSSRPLSPPAHHDPRSNGSIRQSPPPTDNKTSMIPAQAVFSPPDSSQNSSDEEGSPGGRRRGRDLGSLEEQLMEAIKSLPQPRSSSPDPTVPRKTPSLEHETERPLRPRMVHHRSSSESMLFAPEFRRRGSEDDDDEYRLAPPMIRKKSGELVKSSLKSPIRSRPTSMPSTPTFPKNVHFNSNMEQVRHFLHSERPSAVSAGSSPVENFEMESEFPFHPEDAAPTFEWELVLPNFPKDLESRNHLPVRLEKACLSNDKKNLLGTVAVANIAYQKSVVARFTFDYWQTVSEVSAEYSHDIRRKQAEDGVDRFVFKIKLAEQANLENKTLFFCIRYNVVGQEHWDNNGGVNFQIDFKKIITPSVKVAAPRSSGLPRSKPVNSGPRPISMPNFEDFELFDDAFFERAKELGSRKPSKPKAVSKEDTAIPARRANPSGNAFGNRYDFGASLSAAIKAASSAMGPDMGRVQKEKEDPTPVENPYFSKPADVPVAPQKDLKIKMLALEKVTTTPLDSPSVTGAGPPEVFRPETVFGDKPSIESPSYRELLDNYCFFGTAKTSRRSPSVDPDVKKSGSLVSQSPLSTPEQTIGASYAASAGNATPSPPSLSIAQQKASGNASPIPINYAGLRHKRRASGAFRFDTPQASTAIC